MHEFCAALYRIVSHGNSDLLQRWIEYVLHTKRGYRFAVDENS